ncbi:hypothetical protein [Arthrobacter sp. NPDC093139]|uniref:hypothetical protein n=1 Tax=Arthrobacter sp. NPDC093139 TaxID=3363945 RepID=UPI00381BF8A2
MSSTDLTADPLHPGFERDPWKLPVAALGNPVPDGDANLLHDVVNIAGSSDPSEAGNNVAVHPINRDQNPVYGDNRLPGWGRAA